MYYTKIATITPNGIVFNSRAYTCNRAIKEQWFGYSIHNGKTIPILYHPDDISTVILGPNEGGDLCRMVIITPFEGKRLTEYHEALDCLKISREKHSKIGYKSRFKEKRL